MKEDQTPLIGDFAKDAGPEAVSAEPQQEGQQEGKKRGFSSKIGFVLAAAGSAVGLGNLWRFPYLAAKYGGGFFILCYILLAITVGFTLLILEIAIGRKTGKGVIGAFATLNKKFKWFGFFCLAVPIIIVPYYSVIGGWVLKYLAAFTVGDMASFADSDSSAAYFSSFIGNSWQPLIYFLVFAVLTVLVVIFGVQKGIERVSKILMPILAILTVGLAIYAVCQPGALAGLKKLFVPDLSGYDAKKIFSTLLAALGQLFYSMSLAMCIMITYGSYMKKSANIQTSARQISICDTLFAIFAATIIIPSIYSVAATTGSDAAGMMESSGPSLMFVVLPQVFDGMVAGRFIGMLFFLLVFFAALTSSISLVEAIVAVLRENCHLKRWVSCLIVFGIMLVLGTLSSLGNGPLSNVLLLERAFLDFFDFISNSVMMPIVAIITCILVGYFMDRTLIMDEIGLKKKLSRSYFSIMIRYIAPVCMLAILISGLFLTL